MKKFKAFCDCFIKICQSLKGRGISEFPNTVFRAIYVLPVYYTCVIKRFSVLRQKPSNILPRGNDKRKNLPFSVHFLMIHLFQKVFKYSVKKLHISNSVALWNLKGTLMQIWKSVTIFVFIWKQYVKDFTLKHLLFFEICTRERCLQTFRNNRIC